MNMTKSLCLRSPVIYFDFSKDYSCQSVCSSSLFDSETTEVIEMSLHLFSCAFLLSL
jgi:hypothetical protein